MASGIAASSLMLISPLHCFEDGINNAALVCTRESNSLHHFVTSVMCLLFCARDLSTKRWWVMDKYDPSEFRTR